MLLLRRSRCRVLQLPAKLIIPHHILPIRRARSLHKKAPFPATHHAVAVKPAFELPELHARGKNKTENDESDEDPKPREATHHAVPAVATIMTRDTFVFLHRITSFHICFLNLIM